MSALTRASLRALCAGLVLSIPTVACAQELEPGAYWPLPSRLNILTLTNAFKWGDLAFEPSAPIDEADATINTTAFAYTRTFDLAGRSAAATLVAPVVLGHIEGLYLGTPSEVDRFGFGDPRARFSVNLHGAPSMTSQEFATYRLRTIVGTSFTVAPPLGEYDPAKLINIGTNRWAFKPDVGVSHGLGRWILEGMAGVWLFTDNAEFLGERVREQDPILETQLHLTYRFDRFTWLAADANFYTGGQTTIDGTRNLDLQRNSRVGLTFSTALDRHHSLRASVSRGAYTTIGADFTSIAVGYNYSWSK